MTLGHSDVSHSSQPTSETTLKVLSYTSCQNNVTMDDPVSSQGRITAFLWLCGTEMRVDIKLTTAMNVSVDRT